MTKLSLADMLAKQKAGVVPAATNKESTNGQAAASVLARPVFNLRTAVKPTVTAVPSPAVTANRGSGIGTTAPAVIEVAGGADSDGTEQAEAGSGRNGADAGGIAPLRVPGLGRLRLPTPASSGDRVGGVTGAASDVAGGSPQPTDLPDISAPVAGVSGFNAGSLAARIAASREQALKAPVTQVTQVTRPATAPQSTFLAGESLPTAPVRNLPADLDEQGRAFVAALDMVPTLFHDAEMLGQVIRSIMVMLKTHKPYEDMVLDGDIQSIVRASKEVLGLARIKKTASKAKAPSKSASKAGMTQDDLDDINELFGGLS